MMCRAWECFSSGKLPLVCILQVSKKVLSNASWDRWRRRCLVYGTVVRRALKWIVLFCMTMANNTGHKTNKSKRSAFSNINNSYERNKTVATMVATMASESNTYGAFAVPTQGLSRSYPAMRAIAIIITMYTLIWLWLMYEHQDVAIQTVNARIVDAAPIDTSYLIGVGIADITGPAADVNMMGYAVPKQKASGIHLRLRSRAFITVDPITGRRVVFVSADICMSDTAVRNSVLQKLNETYGRLYNAQNVALAGTHTHAGPGGFLQYALYQITSLGYIAENTETIATGIYESITRAHNSLQPGNLHVISGQLLGANINRSPYAYDRNPKKEKERYGRNTDNDMVLIRYTNANGAVLGTVNWFAVHCTSMYNNNTLISGDNKGYASYLMEKAFNGHDSLPGAGPAVHAFAQSNMGDVSPNTEGAFCEDTDELCDYKTSMCNGKNELCRGRGPGWRVSDAESTRIIGERQFRKAMQLVRQDGIRVTGPVDSKHEYVDMSNYEFRLNGNDTKLCPPALGTSFAAGTTDGPGVFDFRQSGNATGNLFWRLVSRAIKTPSEEQIACHLPKPILIDATMTFPYQWVATVVDMQLFKLGRKFAIVVVPAEFSTMAGRRLRNAVKRTLIENRVLDKDGTVVLSGPANAYAHYITTREEYQVQRYEGASNIYGPNTLDAYIDIFVKISGNLANGTIPRPGVNPPDITSKCWRLLPGIIVDVPPLGKRFGDVIEDFAQGHQFHAGERVEAQFVGGNPRSDHMRESSFLYVQRHIGDDGDNSAGKWIVYRTDGDWSTRYVWLGSSTVLITWDVEPDTPPGKYRIFYQGVHKTITGEIEQHHGTTSEFFIVNE